MTPIARFKNGCGARREGSGHEPASVDDVYGSLFSNSNYIPLFFSPLLLSFEISYQGYYTLFDQFPLIYNRYWYRPLF